MFDAPARGAVLCPQLCVSCLYQLQTRFCAPFAGAVSTFRRCPVAGLVPLAPAELRAGAVQHPMLNLTGAPADGAAAPL